MIYFVIKIFRLNQKLSSGSKIIIFYICFNDTEYLDLIKLRISDKSIIRMRQ